MKRNLSFVAFALSFIMLFSCVPMTGFATQIQAEQSTPTQPLIIYFESAFARRGETVDVKLCIRENPGIAGATISVSYDDQLELVSINEDGVFEPLDFTAPEVLTNPVVFNWDTLSEEVSEDGMIMVLTFRVDQDADIESLLNIDVVCKDGDVFNNKLETMEVTAVDATVRVIDYIPADINGDGVLNGKDVTLLRRFNANYAVDILAKAADVNGDDVINNKDVTLIRRKLAGWDVVLLPSKYVCNHSLKHVEAVDRTCTEDGHIEYWICSECEVVYSDVDAGNEISIRDTVIGANGHTPIVLPAVSPDYTNTGLTEGEYCGTCKDILVEQKVIPALEPEYFNITYSNLCGVESPTLTRYASHLGVKDTEMPVLTRDGYTFLGFYTAIEGGERVYDIPAGSTRNYHLYARWSDAVSYKIIYKDAPINNNPSTYTVEDCINLADPQWQGLSFAYWTDAKGNIVDRIPEGTTGAIELTAHWRTVENLAIPNESDDFLVVYDETSERYHFIYKMGDIQNVVLDRLYSYKYDGSSEFRYSLERTVRVEEGAATSVAQTIVHSLTQTENWSFTTEKVREHSVSKSAEYTKCPELEFAGIKGKIYEASIGNNKIDKDSYSEISYTGNSKEFGDEQSTQISSILSYVRDTSTTVKKEIILDPTASRAGQYNYVYAADIAVYAIVSYDPATGDYYLDTYSMIYAIFETTIFEVLPEYNSINILPTEKFSFEVPVDEMVAFVEDCYYVFYDANGGTGEQMPMSTLKHGVDQTILNNKYTREGYAMVGWRTDDGQLIQDGAMVRDLCGRGETITLKAEWLAIPYTLSYEKGINCTIVVERISSPNVGAHTGKLESGDVIYLGDQLQIIYVATTGHSVQESGATQITVTGDVAGSDVYAVATVNNYVIQYVANGGSGEMSNMTCVYGSSFTLDPCGFSKKGWIFAGWADENGNIYSDQASVSNLTAEKDGYVKLYAQWELDTVYTANLGTQFGSLKVTSLNWKGYSMNIASLMDLEYLAKNGYKATVTVTYDIGYIDGKCKAYFVLKTGTGSSDGSLKGAVEEYESSKTTVNGSKPGQSYTTENVTTQDLSRGYLAIYFDAAGMNIFDAGKNSYYVNNLVVTVTFSK